MAVPYPLAPILNRPVGDSVTETLSVQGRPVEVTATNQDETVHLTLTGDWTLEDRCARCGEAVTVPITIDGQYDIRETATEDEIADGIVTLDRQGQVDLEQLVIETAELARPTIAYCPNHQKSHPKSFIIE